MPWWGWIVLGVLLLGAEVVLPTDFWLVFIGLSALAVGGIAYLAPGLPATGEWALFGVLAAVSVLFFRRLVRERFASVPADGRADDTLVGQTGWALEPLAPGAMGRVELRGSTWSARNAGAAAIASGARVRVERVEGLTLHVQPEA
ncbi:MAG TPA: NfeD family protein [Myxococcota bacterium]